MRALRILLVALLSMPAAAIADDAIGQFSWMTGCWGSGTATDGYEEVWLAPTANSMLGVSREIARGQTRSFEYLRIMMATDSIDYVAQPRGNPPTAFRLKELKGTRAMFENPAHDFPQRIIYQYTAPDRLDARIEGTDPKTGKVAGEDYPLRRKPCGG